MEIQTFRIGDFKIVFDPIKIGSQGYVQKGYHSRHGDVAIKTYNNGYCNNEANLLMQNNFHQNIVQFIGILVNDSSQWIGYIMPYMSMGNLHDGKSYDDVRLSDFGTARSLKNFVGIPTSGRGTYYYMAPEILKGKNYDVSADVYSLSITIWEIVHRRCWHSNASDRFTIDDVLEFCENTKFYVLDRETIILLRGQYEATLDNVLILESSEKNWKELNIKLPDAISYHGAQFLDDSLYIFGGENKIKEILNLTYKLSKSLQWGKVADINHRRSGISNSSVTLNKHIYVCGGWNGNEELNSVEMYNPETNEWRDVEDMKECRTSAAAAVVDEKIFCCGGYSGKKMLNSVECYDPSSNVWTLIYDMPEPEVGHGAVGMDGNLIVMGGYNDQGELSNVWSLDTLEKNAEWITKPSMSLPRSHFGIARIDGKIFVCGGESGGRIIENVEIFERGTWINGPELKTVRETSPAIVIPTEFAKSLN